MIKVIIADDHPTIREGLKKIISKSHDIIVSDEVSSGNELLKKIKKDNYDVVILDISMPGTNGIEVLKDLRNINQRLPVLILSAHPEEQYAVRALKAGAAGYLTKGCASDEIIKAIRKIALGGKYVSSTLAEQLADELRFDRESLPHEKLSDREYQVMILLAAGNSTGEIAEKLCLSPPTISTYRSRILQKLNLKNNAHLIHYALKNNLL